MQLVLDREELQVAAELVEARLYQCAHADPNGAETAAMEALLDGILKRRLQFDYEQLDALHQLLDEEYRRNASRLHLSSLRDKVTEACAML